MLFTGIVVFASDDGFHDIPLPGSKDIQKYIELNINRFDNTEQQNKICIYIQSITSIPEFDRVFEKNKIFRVDMNQAYLARRPSPLADGSHGFFATDGNRILYLNWPNVDNIEELLSNENLLKYEFDANRLLSFCGFFTKTLLHESPRFTSLLFSTIPITSLAETHKGYEINKLEFKRIEPIIKAPIITGDSESGIKIEFFTFCSYMYPKTLVSRHTVQISPEYKIEHAKEDITTELFSKVPLILYD
jgi:hypothetical protein